MAMNWENVELIRNTQRSAQKRFDAEHIVTQDKIEEAMKTEAFQALAVPQLTELEAMLFKMRAELIDYIVAHGLVDGLIWNGVLQPVQSGKIVITKEMVELITEQLGYYTEADVQAFLEEYLPENNYIRDAEYVHTDNNFTDGERDKLAGIEAGAEVNKVIDILFNGVTVLDDGTRVASITITPEDIKKWYESNPDTNAFTDAQKAKLAGIADGAEVNRVDDVLVDGRSVLDENKKAKITAEIVKDAYESNPDTNAFTDADKEQITLNQEQIIKNAEDIEAQGVKILKDEKRITALEEKTEETAEKVTTLEGRADTTDKNLETIQTNVATLKTKEENLETKTEDLETRTTTAETNITTLQEKTTKNIYTLSADQSLANIWAGGDLLEEAGALYMISGTYRISKQYGTPITVQEFITITGIAQKDELGDIYGTVYSVGVPDSNECRHLFVEIPKSGLISATADFLNSSGVTGFRFWDAGSLTITNATKLTTVASGGGAEEVTDYNEADFAVVTISKASAITYKYIEFTPGTSGAEWGESTDDFVTQLRGGFVLPKIYGSGVRFSASLSTYGNCFYSSLILNPASSSLFIVPSGATIVNNAVRVVSSRLVSLSATFTVKYYKAFS